MADRVCSEIGCGDTTVVARGLCARHYRRRRYRGTLPPLSPTTPHAAVTVCAREHGLTVVDLLGPSRDPAVAAARVDAAHRLADLGVTWEATGQLLGGRSASAVGYWLKRPRPDRPAGDPAPVEDGCQVPGCDRQPKHPTMAFCAGHDRRWRRTGGVDPDRPLRPVRQPGPILDLEVHDRTGYRDGCRCDVCRADAVRAVKLNRHRPQTRPVDEAAQVVEDLLATGMTVADVVRASGVCRATIDRWLRREGRARQPTIDKVAAVVPPERTCELCETPSLGGGRWCLDHLSSERRRTAA